MTYKLRSYLKLYKKCELDSTYVEIISAKKSDIIIGVTYQHPTVSVTEFHKYHLNVLLDETSRKQKVSM